MMLDVRKQPFGVPHVVSFLQNIFFCRAEGGTSTYICNPSDFPDSSLARPKIFKDSGPNRAGYPTCRRLPFSLIQYRLKLRAAGKEPDELIISAATSKDIWIPESFLQQRVIATRAARFGERVILKVDKMVNLSNEDRNVEVLNWSQADMWLEIYNRLRRKPLMGRLSMSEIDGGDVDCLLGMRGCPERLTPNKEPESKVRDFEGAMAGISFIGDWQFDYGLSSHPS